MKFSFIPNLNQEDLNDIYIRHINYKQNKNNVILDIIMFNYLNNQ